MLVFPTASFLSQRRQIADAREELTVLDQQNKVLADQAAKLKDDDEIERLAREQYNLVKPGEEAYALLPVLCDDHHHLVHDGAQGHAGLCLGGHSRQGP